MHEQEEEYTLIEWVHILVLWEHNSAVVHSSVAGKAVEVHSFAEAHMFAKERMEPLEHT